MALKISSFPSYLLNANSQAVSPSLFFWNTKPRCSGKCFIPALRIMTKLSMLPILMQHGSGVHSRIQFFPKLPDPRQGNDQIDLLMSSLLEVLDTTLQDRGVNQLSLKDTTKMLSTTGGPNHFTLNLPKGLKRSMVKAALEFVYQELEEIFNSTRDPSVISEGLPQIHSKHFPDDCYSPHGEDFELFSKTIVLINRFPEAIRTVIHDNASEFLSPPKKFLTGGPLYSGTSRFHQKWYKLYVAILFGVDVSSHSKERLLKLPNECFKIKDEDELWAANDFVANFGEMHIDVGKQYE